MSSAHEIPPDYSAAKEVAKIQRALFPLFRERDFISQGRAFVRQMPDGLVRVLDFQTLRDPYYGQFAIEVGVFVPEIWTALMDEGVAPPKSVRPSNCMLRDRIIPMKDGRESRQEWSSQARPDVIAEIEKRVSSEAFTFFDKFSDRDRILAQLEVTEGRVGLGSGPTPILAAIIERHRGGTEIARTRLQSYFDSIGDRNPAHADYVRGLIARLFPEAEDR